MPIFIHMEDLNLDTLRYPIGRFDPATMQQDEFIERSIFALEAFPVKLQNVVNRLDDNQLDTPYRPGGWTVRQVVHHIPDSHLNGYVRFKWALTEDKPLIKGYHRDGWANLADSKLPPHISLRFLSSLHERWVSLMKGLTVQDWEKTFINPDDESSSSLKYCLGMYAWHGEHHRAHIKTLIAREGWE